MDSCTESEAGLLPEPLAGEARHLLARDPSHCRRLVPPGIFSSACHAFFLSLAVMLTVVEPPDSPMPIDTRVVGDDAVVEKRFPVEVYNLPPSDDARFLASPGAEPMAQPRKGASDAQETIQGTWELVGLVISGRDALYAFNKDDRIVFKDDMIIIAKEQQTCKIDWTQKPNEFDLTIPEGPRKGWTAAGIYHLEGDTLKMCWPNEADEERMKVRPKEFATKAADGLTLLTLKRVKP